MLGSFTMFASGEAVSSPRNLRPSGACLSAGKVSEKAAMIRLAKEISVNSSSMSASFAKVPKIGSKDDVANAGASSVNV